MRVSDQGFLLRVLLAFRALFGARPRAARRGVATRRRPRARGGRGQPGPSAPRTARAPRLPSSRRAAPTPRETAPAVPGKWRVFAESVPGTSHKKVGKPGQDAHCWTMDAAGRLVAAVADGAGSAPHGGEAAACASRVAVETALDLLEAGGRNPREILRRAVAAARLALEAESARRDCPLSHLATTLIVTIATREVVAVAQIGDGFALALNPDEELVGYSVPQGGEFANETVFLTGRRAVENADLSLWKGPISGVAMSSDGLERIALQFPQKEPYRPFFDEIFHYCETHPEAAHRQLSRLINSARVAERTSDDLTLLVAWNQVAARPAPAR
jgi:hypothetical protein